MPVKQLTKTILFSLLLAGSYLPGPAASATSDTAAGSNPAAHHSGVFMGELLESFNSGGYTYVKIKTEQGPVWAAGPVTTIKKEDRVSFIGKVAMMDFYSKSLDRRFETIYFVDSFIVNGVRVGTTTVDPHKNVSKQAAAALRPFDKAENGQTIAEILAGKQALAGKTVKVRGQVSKYTAGVLGKNWLHIRDSSSDQDITVTTDATTKLDDIVLAEGRLILDKDYGYGYIYEVVIEDAKVAVEPAK